MGRYKKGQYKVTVRRNGNGSLGNREIGNDRLPQTNHKLASSHALEPGNYHSCRKPRFKLLFFGFLSQMDLDNFATARRSSYCHRFFTVHPLPIFLLPIFSLPFFLLPKVPLRFFPDNYFVLPFFYRPIFRCRFFRLPFSRCIFSVVVISDIIFCCPFFLPSYFSLPLFQLPILPLPFLL